MRNLLFLSHANPEDNVFSRWLALQLAKEGYGVWCDQTRLLGGEDFWADIEGAIRARACKLLYVLSSASNHKSGPLQELHVAQSVARRENFGDFVIPLRIDETLAHAETNIQLARINAIDFTAGWATGLRTLLKKLAEDNVQKDERFDARAVASWWRSQIGSTSSILDEPEEYLSNWFSIRTLPPTMYFHVLHPSYAKAMLLDAFPFPVRRHKDCIVSFAPLGDLAPALPTPGMIRATHEVTTATLLAGISEPIIVRPMEARDIVLDLLRRGWEGFLKEAGMWTHLFGRHRIAGYLRDEIIKGNRIKVPGSARSTRQMVGYRARRDSAGKVTSQTFWHFAIEGQPMLHPIAAFRVVPHVLFSSDGQQIWSDRRRLHRARRTECKDWWNPEWRDRTMAVMGWLADNQGDLRIRFSSVCEVAVAASPECFAAPVSYEDPEAAPMPDPDEADEFDEDETNA